MKININSKIIVSTLEVLGILGLALGAILMLLALFISQSSGDLGLFMVGLAATLGGFGFLIVWHLTRLLERIAAALEGKGK